MAKNTDSNPFDKPMPSKCFRCGLPGHRSNAFLNRNMSAYVEEVHEDDMGIDFGDDLNYIDEFAQLEGEVVNLMV